MLKKLQTLSVLSTTTSSTTWSLSGELFSGPSPVAWSGNSLPTRSPKYFRGDMQSDIASRRALILGRAFLPQRRLHERGYTTEATQRPPWSWLPPGKSAFRDVPAVYHPSYLGASLPAEVLLLHPSMRVSLPKCSSFAPQEAHGEICGCSEEGVHRQPTISCRQCLRSDWKFLVVVQRSTSLPKRWQATCFICAR